MSEPTGARRYGTGGGDAYYDAVRYGGYKGTREQFGKDQAEFATNATAVAAAKEVVEQDTEEVRSTKETFVNTTVPDAITAIQQEGTTQVQAVTQQGEKSSQQVETVGTQWKDEVANEGRARVQAVEQAGTNQVQAVNDAGTAQVGAVNQAGADQVTAVEQAGTDQVQAVTDEGTTQIGAVTGEGDTQVQRVQDKGDEIIASIPADYTALDQEVDNLNLVVKLDPEIRAIAQANGYMDYIHFDWESGSINYPSGSDRNPDVNVIRTPLPRFQLSGNIKIILLNDKYRIRYYIFQDTSGDAIDFSDWYNTPGKNSIAIDTAKYYRIQIATNTASSMDMSDALKSILVVYDDAKVIYLTENDFTLFANTERWEAGSINATDGSNATDSISIRYIGKQYFDSDIKIVFLKNTYRVRFFVYNADGSYSGSTDWIYPGNNDVNPVLIDKSKRYRIQITTYNDPNNISMDDALSAIKIYPIGHTLSFWKTYIDNKVNIINTYLENGNDKSAFLFLTDTHWNNNPEYLNHYGINVDLMQYVSERCNIGILIHGGDLNSEHRSNKYIARLHMIRPVSMMREAFDNVFLTRGNHDDNLEGGNNVWDYVITQSDSYSYMFRNTKAVVFGETGTYFYHDIPHEKLRIISLDCVDFPYENTVDPTKSDLKILAYGYTQLQWLCDILRETPSGYHIVIYTHAMLAPSAVTIDHPTDSIQTRAKDYLTVCDILKAYKNRQNYSAVMDGSFVDVHKDYYTGTLSGDFTNSGATIVGVFSGHEHIDCIEEILDSNGNGIGIYNTCTQNSSNLFADTIISHSYQHPMEIGTTSELVWDVVIIDRSVKRVYMIRIGANAANTDVEEVNIRDFYYT